MSNVADDDFSDTDSSCLVSVCDFGRDPCLDSGVVALYPRDGGQKIEEDQPSEQVPAVCDGREEKTEQGCEQEDCICGEGEGSTGSDEGSQLDDLSSILTTIGERLREVGQECCQSASVASACTPNTREERLNMLKDLIDSGEKLFVYNSKTKTATVYDDVNKMLQVCEKEPEYCHIACGNEKFKPSNQTGALTMEYCEDVINSKKKMKRRIDNEALTGDAVYGDEDDIDDVKNLERPVKISAIKAKLKRNLRIFEDDFFEEDRVRESEEIERTYGAFLDFLEGDVRNAEEGLQVLLVIAQTFSNATHINELFDFNETVKSGLCEGEMKILREYGGMLMEMYYGELKIAFQKQDLATATREFQEDQTVGEDVNAVYETFIAIAKPYEHDYYFLRLIQLSRLRIELEFDNEARADKMMVEDTTEICRLVRMSNKIDHTKDMFAKLFTEHLESERYRNLSEERKKEFEGRLRKRQDWIMRQFKIAKASIHSVKAALGLKRNVMLWVIDQCDKYRDLLKDRTFNRATKGEFGNPDCNLDELIKGEVYREKEINRLFAFYATPKYGCAPEILDLLKTRIDRFATTKSFFHYLLHIQEAENSRALIKAHVKNAVNHEKKFRMTGACNGEVGFNPDEVLSVIETAKGTRMMYRKVIRDVRRTKHLIDAAVIRAARFSLWFARRKYHTYISEHERADSVEKLSTSHKEEEHLEEMQVHCFHGYVTRSTRFVDDEIEIMEAMRELNSECFETSLLLANRIKKQMSGELQQTIDLSMALYDPKVIAIHDEVLTEDLFRYLDVSHRQDTDMFRDILKVTRNKGDNIVMRRYVTLMADNFVEFDPIKLPVVEDSVFEVEDAEGDAVEELNLKMAELVNLYFKFCVCKTFITTHHETIPIILEIVNKCKDVEVVCRTGFVMCEMVYNKGPTAARTLAMSFIVFKIMKLCELQCIFMNVLMEWTRCLLFEKQDSPQEECIVRDLTKRTLEVKLMDNCKTSILGMFDTFMRIKKDLFIIRKRAKKIVDRIDDSDVERESDEEDNEDYDNEAIKTFYEVSGKLFSILRSNDEQALLYLNDYTKNSSKIEGMTMSGEAIMPYYSSAYKFRSDCQEREELRCKLTTWNRYSTVFCNSTINCEKLVQTMIEKDFATRAVAVSYMRMKCICNDMMKIDNFKKCNEKAIEIIRDEVKTFTEDNDYVADEILNMDLSSLVHTYYFRDDYEIRRKEILKVVAVDGLKECDLSHLQKETNDFALYSGIKVGDCEGPFNMREDFWSKMAATDRWYPTVHGQRITNMLCALGCRFKKHVNTVIDFCNPDDDVVFEVIRDMLNLNRFVIWIALSYFRYTVLMEKYIRDKLYSRRAMSLRARDNLLVPIHRWVCTFFQMYDAKWTQGENAETTVSYATQLHISLERTFFYSVVKDFTISSECDQDVLKFKIPLYVLQGRKYPRPYLIQAFAGRHFVLPGCGESASGLTRKPVLNIFKRPCNVRVYYEPCILFENVNGHYRLTSIDEEHYNSGFNKTVNGSYEDCTELEVANTSISLCGVGLNSVNGVPLEESEICFNTTQTIYIEVSVYSLGLFFISFEKDTHKETSFGGVESSVVSETLNEQVSAKRRKIQREAFGCGGEEMSRALGRTVSDKVRDLPTSTFTTKKESENEKNDNVRHAFSIIDKKTSWKEYSGIEDLVTIKKTLMNACLLQANVNIEDIKRNQERWLNVSLEEASHYSAQKVMEMLFTMNFREQTKEELENRVIRVVFCVRIEMSRELRRGIANYLESDLTRTAVKVPGVIVRAISKRVHGKILSMLVNEINTLMKQCNTHISDLGYTEDVFSIWRAYIKMYPVYLDFISSCACEEERSKISRIIKYFPKALPCLDKLRDETLCEEYNSKLRKMIINCESVKHVVNILSEPQKAIFWLVNYKEIFRVIESQISEEDANMLMKTVIKARKASRERIPFLPERLMEILKKSTTFDYYVDYSYKQVSLDPAWVKHMDKVDNDIPMIVDKEEGTGGSVVDEQMQAQEMPSRITEEERDAIVNEEPLPPLPVPEPVPINPRAPPPYPLPKESFNQRTKRSLSMGSMGSNLTKWRVENLACAQFEGDCPGHYRIKKPSPFTLSDSLSRVGPPYPKTPGPETKQRQLFFVNDEGDLDEVSGSGATCGSEDEALMSAAQDLLKKEEGGGTSGGSVVDDQMKDDCDAILSSVLDTVEQSLLCSEVLQTTTPATATKQ